MEPLTIIKEIFISITAIITSTIAIKGLYIWRNQLKGTNEYKLSGQILEKTYKLQDAIRSARIPWVSVGELSQRERGEKISETETSSEREAKNEAYALWKRTEPVFGAVSELKISKFEAMALWGKDSVWDIDSIIKKAYELRNAQSAYFQMKINPSLKDKESMDLYWRIIYEMPEDEDKFWEEVNGVVLKIESRFRVYLK